MFTAYFDDSGTNSVHRVAVLAGFVARDEDWKRFDADWDQLIAHPLVPYFKAHDCDKGDGVYRGVPEDVRQQPYDEALTVVCRHPLICVAIAGRKQDFEGQWVKCHRPEFINSKFHMSVRSTFLTLSLMLDDRRINDRVALICESGNSQDNQIVTDTYGDLLNDTQWPDFGRRFIGPPAFHRKADFYGLQAADLLAYEVGIEYARRTDGKDIAPRHGWLQLLEHGRRHGGALRLMQRFSSAMFGFGDEDCGI